MEKLKYKQFGIYTDPENKYLSILTHVSKNEVLGIDFPLYGFDDLSNTVINNWLFEMCENIINGYGEVFHVDLDEYSNIFKDYGYLGLIQDVNLGNNLKWYVQGVWEG